ncbi:MAG: class I SAM-dependent methyltransferase [Devosia sp.]|nr:class I SAM-dependent methyltransferase [Devosia sp.]
MDLDQYWAIAEQDIEIGNPVTDRKLRLLDDYCDIRDGLRVLDIGCGKAWLLRYWAERFAIEGTGVDTNRYFLDFARSKPPARGRLQFVPAPALDFRPPAGFDVVMCVGASQALGGLVGAVDRMVELARPGGSVVIGELTLRHRPLAVTEALPQDPIDTIGIIERHGAEVSAMISASEADLERYVSHHRHSTLKWGREHPGHPDQQAILAKSRADWVHYLKLVRPNLGFTIFVGRRSGG